jgi:hypothetical protein
MDCVSALNFWTAADRLDADAWNFVTSFAERVELLVHAAAAAQMKQETMSLRMFVSPLGGRLPGKLGLDPAGRQRAGIFQSGLLWGVS